MVSEKIKVESLPEPLRSYHIRALLMRQSSAIDFPAHVHLETQTLCTGSCIFCPYKSLQRKGTKMEDSLIEKVINELCDIPRLHRFQLSLFKVNEPFLDSRIFDITELCIDKLPNATVTLTTNASVLDEDKLNRLSKISDRLGYLWISLNEHREEEYEKVMGLKFRSVISKVELIHRFKSEGKLKCKVVVSRVSDGTEQDRLFVDWIKQRFPLFGVSLFQRGNWLGQVKIEQVGAVPPVACTRWFDLSIISTGEVAHCCMDGEARYSIGNVKQKHLLEIYDNPDYRRLREQVLDRREVMPCKVCNFL